MNLTIFTVPKPFRGLIGTIQNNAIESWTLLKPKPKIVLCYHEPSRGDVEKVKGQAFLESEESPMQSIVFAANRYDCYRIPTLSAIEGFPLVSEAFHVMQQRFKAGILMYVNCDIIIHQKLQKAIELVADRFERFLVVGQRWDFRQNESIDFSASWVSDVDRKAKAFGKLDPPVCIDYFAFHPGHIPQMPPFMIGQYAWDSWILWTMDKDPDVAVVDVTPYVLVYHQNHEELRNPRDSKLADRNRSLLDSQIYDDGGGFIDRVQFCMDEGGKIHPRSPWPWKRTQSK